MEREKKLWRQRSCITWLAGGDRNTQFFLNKASQRRKINHIEKLKNHTGEWKEGQDRDKLINDYFKELFTTSSSNQNWSFLDSLSGRVIEEMNRDLSKFFTREEVILALKQMNPSKAPGPDGMVALFFLNYWDILGPVVSEAMVNALNIGTIPFHLNLIFITLIPKKKRPECIADFRSISLCNVLYKLVAKVLANRLKNILPNIIFPSQSAFVPRRIISNNILVAFEIMHFLNHKRGGKEGYMSLKLNISKAYNRVK